MKAFLVLVTTPDRRTSDRIAKGLVEGRLAACVNVLPGLRSRYRWKGKVETAREELLLIKTGRPRLGQVTRWVRAHHPYSVCEVIALPILEGNPAYLKWLRSCLR